MNRLIDDLKEIFSYLRQYKARTAMTMFGIIWGTFTVILLLAFGVGVKKQLSVNMHGMGEGFAGQVEPVFPTRAMAEIGRSVLQKMRLN